MNSSNKIIFIAELAGTFGLVVAATGSIVYNGILDGALGIAFIAFGHFIGLTIVVYAFGKYSMAHFNPAVTIGFFITGHVKGYQLPVYFIAQTTGAFLGSIFVLFVMGDYANIGTNAPNLQYEWVSIIGIEILATVFLMWVIFIVVSSKKLAKLSGMAIGGIVALDVLFFGELSGASMNPIRSLAPAIVIGIPHDLWLYCTTPFIGTIITALFYRKKFLTKAV